MRTLALLLATFLAAPDARAEGPNDSFITGYATAVMERQLRLQPCALTVQNGTVTVRAQNLSGADRDRVEKALASIKGVKEVVIEELTELLATKQELVLTNDESGISAKIGSRGEVFLPRKSLFGSLLADPRWPHFSGTYQYYVDDDEIRNVGAANFGLSFGIFGDDVPLGGSWQFGVQTGVFAIFDFDAASNDLINADYWIGFPFSYRKDDFSALFRIFHQSSHLGDEFLLRDRVDRINLSYEGVNLLFSYDLDEQFRAYAGGGYLLRTDPTGIEPWSSQFGLEFTSRASCWNGTARPVAAVDIQNRGETDWGFNVSARAGIQLENASVFDRRVQFLLEYFDGNSPNGQFYERSIQYLGIGMHIYLD